MSRGSPGFDSWSGLFLFSYISRLAEVREKQVAPQQYPLYDRALEGSEVDIEGRQGLYKTKLTYILAKE